MIKIELDDFLEQISDNWQLRGQKSVYTVELTGNKELIFESMLSQVRQESRRKALKEMDRARGKEDYMRETYGDCKDTKQATKELNKLRKEYQQDPSK